MFEFWPNMTIYRSTYIVSIEISSKISAEIFPELSPEIFLEILREVKGRQDAQQKHQSPPEFEQPLSIETANQITVV